MISDREATMQQDTTTYWQGLQRETEQVFQANPSFYNHLHDHPWLTGALGDPYAGIWFIAENPSLTQVERVKDPLGGPPTKEAQWFSSRGDKLFRDMLLKHGFKSGGIESHGGWHCYITNVIKECDYTKNWREKPQELRNQSAVIWSSVLKWELANSRPKLVVVFGDQALKLLSHLQYRRLIDLPRTEKATHYAYVGQRAQGRLGPMHPERVSGIRSRVRADTPDFQ
jgi:hypothetical protein